MLASWNSFKIIQSDILALKSPAAECVKKLFLTFHSLILGVNPVKPISLACPGINEARLDVNRSGQRAAPSNMCGPAAASRVNPFPGGGRWGTAEGRLWSVRHSQTDTHEKSDSTQSIIWMLLKEPFYQEASQSDSFPTVPLLLTQHFAEKNSPSAAQR